MIDIFQDKLFKMELGRLASEQVLTRRAIAHNEFRRLMVKLKQAEEQPREIRSMTGPYIIQPVKSHANVPQPQPKGEVYDEMRDWLINAQRSLTNPLIPENYRTRLKEYEAFFRRKLSEGQRATPYIATVTSRVPGANPHKLCTCDNKSQCTCREFETMNFKLRSTQHHPSERSERMDKILDMVGEINNLLEPKAPSIKLKETEQPPPIISPWDENWFLRWNRDEGKWKKVRKGIAQGRLA